MKNTLKKIALGIYLLGAASAGYLIGVAHSNYQSETIERTRRHAFITECVLNARALREPYFGVAAKRIREIEDALAVQLSIIRETEGVSEGTLPIFQTARDYYTNFRGSCPKELAATFQSIPKTPPTTCIKKTD